MFSKKTTDGVIKTLTNAIDDLEIVAEHQRDVFAVKSDKAQKLNEEASVAVGEVERAVRVRNKLLKLVE